MNDKHGSNAPLLGQSDLANTDVANASPAIRLAREAGIRMRSLKIRSWDDGGYHPDLH
jgi:hypothetical protein